MYNEHLQRLGYKHVRRNIWRTKTHEARVYSKSIHFGKRPYWWTRLKLVWRCKYGWKLSWWYIRYRMLKFWRRWSIR